MFFFTTLFSSLANNQIVNIDTIGKALETNKTLNMLTLEGNQIVNIDAIGKALETNNTLKELLSVLFGFGLFLF